MPRLWSVAAREGHVTATDMVHGVYRSRALELAVAKTGVAATMPYIALQLVAHGRGHQGVRHRRRMAADRGRFWCWRSTRTPPGCAPRR